MTGELEHNYAKTTNVSNPNMDALDVVTKINIDKSLYIEYDLSVSGLAIAKQRGTTEIII